jgi:putative acetyltransferase
MCGVYRSCGVKSGRLTFGMTVIRRAELPRDTEPVLDIWREFVASPSVSLAHQKNEVEFANIESKYAAPGGCILLADNAGAIEGCIAFRKVSPEICEMKRLYVRPRARGQRLGEQLVESLIGQAKGAGYLEMRLDVLAEFEHARALYARFGFEPAGPISFNPLPGTAFLGLRLR